MLLLREHFLQLIALVLLMLVLFTYAPRIAATLSEKLATATNAPTKLKVKL
jgi:hypothetical protein